METLTRITVEPRSPATVTVTGPKLLLSDARNHILQFAASVDGERLMKYLVPGNPDLRGLLMIALPKLIRKSGGPEDEDEARQMFTM